MQVNEQDKKAAKFLKECGIESSVMLAQIGYKQDDWVCDKWVITIGGESFDYHTGIGHRLIKRGPMGLKGKEQKQAKEVCELLGLDRMPHLVKPTGDRVAIDNSRTMDSMKETVTCPPTQAGLIYSLLLDMEAENESFQNWCDNYGYDSDSRKAERTYFQCQEIASQVHKVFNRDQIETLREILEDY